MERKPICVSMEAPFSEKLKKYITGETSISVVLGDRQGNNNDTDLEIATLYIDRNERNLGKGRKILAEIICLGKEYDFERIWLKAQKMVHHGTYEDDLSMDDIVRFYEKFGFEVQYESHPGIVMKLELKD
jgi:GNAT superfamily N-acetyltransferase